MTEAELTTDEMLANAKRTISKEEMEALFESLRKVSSETPLSAALVAVMGVPDEKGASNYNVAGIGLDTTLIRASLSIIADTLQQYPKGRKMVIKSLKELIDLYADAN